MKLKIKFIRINYYEKVTVTINDTKILCYQRMLNHKSE